MGTVAQFRLVEVRGVLWLALASLVGVGAGCFGTHDPLGAGAPSSPDPGAAAGVAKHAAGSAGHGSSASGAGGGGDGAHVRKVLDAGATKGGTGDAGGGLRRVLDAGPALPLALDAGETQPGATDSGTADSGTNPLPRCVPGRSEACACIDGTDGAQLCDSSGRFGPCVCANSRFERIKQGMVGTWRGTDMNPWTDPYEVQITFEADGHYSGHCAQPMCPDPVFYYGTDSDSPLKTYALRDIRADGIGAGIISIFFDAGTVNQGTLDTVSLSDDGQQLHIEFWNREYGPVVFDLAHVQ